MCKKTWPCITIMKSQNIELEISKKAEQKLDVMTYGSNRNRIDQNECENVRTKRAEGKQFFWVCFIVYTTCTRYNSCVRLYTICECMRVMWTEWIRIASLTTCSGKDTISVHYTHLEHNGFVYERHYIFTHKCLEPNLPSLFVLSFLFTTPWSMYSRKISLGSAGGVQCSVNTIFRIYLMYTHPLD